MMKPLYPDVDVFTVDYKPNDEQQQDLIRTELDKRRGGRTVRQLTIIPGRRSIDARITTNTLRCFVVWDWDAQ